MFLGRSKSKDRQSYKPEAETGSEFYKDESFSFEIEAQKQYVHRLKSQRQKIEALYMKYDSLLGQLKKKDEKVKELERSLSSSEFKCKEMSLAIPELQMFQHENYKLGTENQALKGNLSRLQQSYNDIIKEINTKSTLSEQQVEKIGEINSQLMTRLRIWQQKLEDKEIIHDKQKKMWEVKLVELKKQMHIEQTRQISEIGLMKEELLRKDEEIDILHHELQKFRQNLMYMEQSKLDQAKDSEIKMNRIISQCKQKVKSLKQQIEEVDYNNEMLSSKITMMSLELEKSNQENSNIRNISCDQKKISEEALYHLKLQFSQEKSLMREHNMQLENKLSKTEKQLGDAGRRERSLNDEIQRLQEDHSVKKNIREMERRELQKINRLLLLEK